MSNGNTGSALFVSSNGPANNASIGIALNAPTTIVGGGTFFNEQSEGTGTGYIPAFGSQSMFFASGNFEEMNALVLVNIASGNVIAGTVTSNPPQPNPVTIAVGEAQYILQPGQPSGTFELPAQLQNLSKLDVKAELAKRRKQ